MPAGGEVYRFTGGQKTQGNLRTARKLEGPTDRSEDTDGLLQVAATGNRNCPGWKEAKGAAGQRAAGKVREEVPTAPGKALSELGLGLWRRWQ